MTIDETGQGIRPYFGRIRIFENMGLLLQASQCRGYCDLILLVGTPQHAGGRPVGSALGGLNFGRENKS